MIRPDGLVARWDSRYRRKHWNGWEATAGTWWAPRARGWWIAVLFAVGSALFALGALPPFADAVGTRGDSITFFTGSLFFTAAGFLQYRESVDAGSAGGDRRRFFVLGRDFFELRHQTSRLGIQIFLTIRMRIAALAPSGPMHSPVCLRPPS